MILAFPAVQATLKDFQATMKAAKAKEAASLPRRPEPARGALPPDLEQGGAPQEAERAALLQASSMFLQIYVLEVDNVGAVGCSPRKERLLSCKHGLK